MGNTSIENISTELCTFLHRNIVDKEIPLNADTPFSQLGIDSLATIEMVLFIERKFGIALTEEELIPENFKSVKTLATCAHRHLDNG